MAVSGCMDVDLNQSVNEPLADPSPEPGHRSQGSSSRRMAAVSWLDLEVSEAGLPQRYGNLWTADAAV